MSVAVLAVRRGIEQAMGVNDEVAHARIVDGALRRTLPGVVRRLVVRIGADEIDRSQILELGTVEMLQLAADDEVQQLAMFAHDGFACLGSGKARVRSISKGCRFAPAAATPGARGMG